MLQSLRSLAGAPVQLTVGALQESSIRDEDLERLLQFLTEVNDVLMKALEPLLQCIRAVQRFEPNAIGSPSHLRLNSELEAIQQRQYYNVRLVCNRLHGLRDHATKHIQTIIQGVRNPGEWWSLFAQLDEREGFIEHLVRQAIQELATDFANVATPAQLEAVKQNAAKVQTDVSAALADMEQYALIMHGEADRVGFLALTDMGRSALGRRLATVYNVQQFHGSINMHTGDNFSNITNATIVNRSVVDRSFNKLSSEGNQELAAALLKIAEEIDKSASREASESFEAFNEELQKPEPKKSLLSNAWHGVTQAVPVLLQLPSVVDSIGKLIAMAR
jgi:hypothetical protein